MEQTKWTSVIVHADLEHLRRVPRNVLPILGKHKRIVICNDESDVFSFASKRLTEPQIKKVTGYDCMNHITGEVYNIRDGVHSSFQMCYCNCLISDDHLNATDMEDSDVETESREPDLC